MKSEKINLIIIFSLFFLLSATLFYLMIEKDMRKTNPNIQKNYTTEVKEENIWGNVEIRARE